MTSESEDGLDGIDLAALPVSEFAFPGPLRDKLVAAILSGQKTATAHLYEENLRFDEPMDRPGTLEAVVDSEGRPVCVTRHVSSEVRRLAAVDDDHARREGEGHRDAAEWRRGHERFWTSPEYVAEMGEPPVVLDDDTLVVLSRFEVVRRLDG